MRCRAFWKFLSLIAKLYFVLDPEELSTSQFFSRYTQRFFLCCTARTTNWHSMLSQWSYIETLANLFGIENAKENFCWKFHKVLVKSNSIKSSFKHEHEFPKSDHFVYQFRVFHFVPCEKYMTQFDMMNISNYCANLRHQQRLCCLPITWSTVPNGSS